ncbi:MAG: M28 family peptidase [Pseudomonadota bacterium]
MRRAARGKTKLVIAAESDLTRRFLGMIGGKPSLRTTIEGTPPERGSLSLATLPADALAKIAAGADITLDVPFTTEKAITTNVIGYLPGTDRKAGVILLTAHLDHLGVRSDGTVMPGANDDASGTVAVIELARAFAGMGRQKRGILFVAYGSEEIGGLGSTWFGENPPVPLTDLIANIEFEMIGAQDPKLPKGSLMMTGSERSTLFEMMKANGALIAADPYPDQHFFERSDNYSLALKGIVAHTFSGWAVVPTYHQPTDTVENLDIAFMTRAIQSLIVPIRSLASGSAKPDWKTGGRPK